MVRTLNRFLLSMLWLFGAGVLAETNLDLNDKNQREMWTRLSHSQPVESAGSHGSFGIKVGLGLQVDRSEYEPEAGNADTGPVMMRKVHATKGLPIPVDIGFSFGFEEQQDVMQWSAYVQWTLFEALALPALALRYTYGELTGIPGADLKNQAYAAVASYGFLRYFQVFGVMSHQESRVESDGSSDSGVVNEKSFENISSLGLEIMLVPPFMTLAGQADYGSSALGRGYSAKLAYLF